MYPFYNLTRRKSRHANIFSIALLHCALLSTISIYKNSTILKKRIGWLNLCAQDLSVVTKTKAYTVGRFAGNVLELNLEGERAETKEFRCPKRHVTAVVTDKEKVYVSSVEGYSHGTSTSHIWDFAGGNFDSLLTLDGLIMTMTLSFNKTNLIGVLEQNNDIDERFLFEVNVGPKTKVIAPEKPVKARRSASIKVDKRGWVYVLARDGDVDVYNSKLLFEYSINPNLKADRIAITDDPSYLYVSGNCKNDNHYPYMPCINRLALE